MESSFGVSRVLPKRDGRRCSEAADSRTALAGPSVGKNGQCGSAHADNKLSRTLAESAVPANWRRSCIYRRGAALASQTSGIVSHISKSPAARLSFARAGNATADLPLKLAGPGCQSALPQFCPRPALLHRGAPMPTAGLLHDAAPLTPLACLYERRAKTNHLLIIIDSRAKM